MANNGFGGPGRIERSIGALVFSTMVILGSGNTALANASPADPNAGCAYTLDPPDLTPTLGPNVVTANVSAAKCASSVNPSDTTLCLRASSDDSAGQCVTSAGVASVQVSYPYRPGTTYTAKGVGCVAVYTANESLCRSFGPAIATL
jgi:hypothetical protein